MVCRGARARSSPEQSSGPSWHILNFQRLTLLPRVLCCGLAAGCLFLCNRAAFPKLQQEMFDRKGSVRRGEWWTAREGCSLLNPTVPFLFFWWCLGPRHVFTLLGWFWFPGPCVGLGLWLRAVPASRTRVLRAGGGRAPAPWAGRDGSCFW